MVVSNFTELFFSFTLIWGRKKQFDFYFFKVVESTIIWIQFVGLTRINTTLQQEHRGVLALTARPAQHVPPWYPVFLRIWSVVVKIWRIESWFLSNLAAETFAKLHTKFVKHFETQGSNWQLPKNPPLRQIRKTKGFGAVYEGQWQPELQL